MEPASLVSSRLIFFFVVGLLLFWLRFATVCFISVCFSTFNGSSEICYYVKYVGLTIYLIVNLMLIVILSIVIIYLFISLAHFIKLRHE